MKIVECDLTVIGAGIAGICTAIAAARQGLSVCLVNDRDVPGGNASSEHRVHINGGAVGNSSYYSRESGIADELKMHIFNRNPRYNKKFDYHLSDMALVDKILSENNISYFPGTVVYDCKNENGKIIAVYGFKSKTNENITFVSPLYCDASGDGIVAYKAGAEYKVGREAKDEFGESLAPEKPDKNVMGSCILYTYCHEGKPVKFVKPDFAYDLVDDGIIKYFDRPETGRRLPANGGAYNDTWWLEYGGLDDTVLDADNIDFELKKLIYGYWDYIKNSGKYPDAEDCSIDWIAPYASKRESRRFIAEYIMKQSDIQNAVNFDNAVSTGGWSLDIHDVGGIYGNEKTSAFGEVKSMYNIPFSIMYSKDIANLFLAGRTVSCTHVALGSLRVMETLGAMGQAVGTAASLCKKYNTLPTTVNKKHIKELQSILQRNGQYIIGKPEDCGLANNAKITASSAKRFCNTKEEYELKLDNDITYTLPLDCSKLGTVSIRIKNNTDKETTIRYKVFCDERDTAYTKGELLFEGELKLDGYFDGYLPIDMSVESDEIKKVFLELQKNDDCSVCGSFERMIGMPCFRCGMWRTNIDGKALTYCFKYEDTDNLYAAQNVVNGYSRPVSSPNCWVSNTKDNEWLQLEFEKPVDINEIQLYFNAQFEDDHFNEPIKQLVTGYKITAETENGPKNIEITNNYQPQNFVEFKASKVTKVQIDFIDNNGSDEFEVFAIKVF